MAYPSTLISTIQDFVAETAPGGGTLRGQEPGVVDGLRRCLRNIELRTVPRNREGYQKWLDEHTGLCLSTLSVKIQPWGTVRKCINMFMRSCLCDHYLRAYYALERVEPWAEAPIDSIVATVLKRDAGRGRLPEWPGLKHLQPHVHQLFQSHAQQMALREGFTSAAFLDLRLWVRFRTATQQVAEG